jgi:RHS repeat-associated protein
MGLSLGGNTVQVNGTNADQKWEYFRKQVGTNNASAPQWVGITVTAGQSNESGNLFVARNPENFTYDADGNLLSDGRWSYTWDANNRLIAMTNNTGIAAGACGMTFAYDYQGRRIQKTVWTNSGGPAYTYRFVYDGWAPLAVLDANGNIVASMMWGNDLSGTNGGAAGVGGLLAENLAANGVHFAACDANGNVSALINAATGATSATYEYGPFGEPIRVTGSVAFLNPLRFSTKYEDTESGFYYYGYRYYNPSTGRWLSQDPSGEQGGKNLYGFVLNNPINSVDPTGLWNLWSPTTWGVPNSVGWSFWSSLNPFHPSSGFSLQTASEDDAAFLDGLNPFGNPFAHMGLYDENNPGRKWSRGVGIGTGLGESLLGGGAAIKALGPRVWPWFFAGGSAAGNPVTQEELQELLQAADATAGAGLNLSSGAQQMLAGTQNGTLLGIIEKGQVFLFESGTGQIMGHSDLLNAGLISKGAQGFSIAVQNGNVTAIFANSILNPASANYVLPSQTIQQILQALGATGAKIFP